MKVGDWVLVTPDDYDRTSHRKMFEPVVARIVKFDNTPGFVWVKFLFGAATDKWPWEMTIEQCRLISEVVDASQSNRT